METEGLMWAAIFALLCGLLVGLPAFAATAPRLTVSLADIAVPDRPFDESADANAVVANAFARAKTAHKRVLIDLGGNWCADCRILAGVMELPEMRRFRELDVDVSRDLDAVAPAVDE